VAQCVLDGQSFTSASMEAEYVRDAKRRHAMTTADLLKRAREGNNVKVRPLAEAVGLSLNSFYAACRRGEIQTVRVGRAITVPGREALRLLSANEASAA
jgi:hypothetical protein